MVTNYEKIKNMSISEMAMIFKEKFCEECYRQEGEWKDCIQKDCWAYNPKYYEKWLNEKAGKE